MKKTLIVAAIGLVLGACAGSTSVVTVDGVSFEVDDIPIETAESTIDLDTYRNALNWIIRDQVLMSAAEEEFGISFAESELQERASAALASLSEVDQQDPRANLRYFLIQARVGVEGLLWPEVVPQLPEGVSQNQWAIDQLSAAAVEVDARYGEWRVSPEPLVYGP